MPQLSTAVSHLGIRNLRTTMLDESELKYIHN